MKKKPLKNKRGVVYTCITGGYDAVRNHSFISSEWDYVCFTDQIPENKEQYIWEFRKLSFTDLDDVRNQRWHKLHPHKLFPDYAQSIWVDGIIDVVNEEFFNGLGKLSVQDKKFALSIHPERDCIYDELDACIQLGKDNEMLMRKQVDLIRASGFPKNYGLFETGVMYRKHHDANIISIMEDWWLWIKNYSRRDQLSLTFVLWQHRYVAAPLSKYSLRENPCIAFFPSEQHVTKEELIVQKKQLSQELLYLEQELIAKKSVIELQIKDIEQKNQDLEEGNKLLRRRDEELAGNKKLLEQKDQELYQRDQRIHAQENHIILIQQSKFWKARELYLKIKNGLVFALFNPKKFVKKYSAFFGRKPLISVIIPVYDRVEELRQSIDSILNQTYNNIELILVTDGSPKETEDVVRSYETKFPKKVRAFYYDNNTGNAVRGRNKGIKEARGEYIAFQDSDDIALPYRLALSMEYMNKHNADVVYGGWEAMVDGTRADTGLRDGQRVISPECDLNFLLKTCVPCQSTVMVKRRALLDVGGLKPAMKYREDHELWVRLAYFGYVFKAIPEIIERLRIHKGNNELNFKENDSYWEKELLSEYKKKQPLSIIEAL